MKCVSCGVDMKIVGSIYAANPESKRRDNLEPIEHEWECPKCSWRARANAQ